VTKRKRRKARPQQRRHLEHLARSGDAQEHRRLQQEIAHRLEASSQLQEAARRLMTSPLARPSDELVALMRRGPLRLDDWQPSGKAGPPPPKPSKKRGGRKPHFEPEQIARFQQKYRRALKRDPKLKKHEAALAWLRPRLPKAKRDESPGTLKRHIIRPVLNPK
jgi:hypothetical protein